MRSVRRRAGMLLVLITALLGPTGAPDGIHAASAPLAPVDVDMHLPQLVMQDTINLSESSGSVSRRPQVAVAVEADRGSVHVVWEEATTVPGREGSFDLMHRFRPFDPITGDWMTSDWSSPRIVQQVVSGPTLDARGGTVVVAYQVPGLLPGDIPEIAISRFRTDSLSWEGPFPVAVDDIVITAGGKEADIVVDPSDPTRLWLTWIDTQDNRATPHAARLNLSGVVELAEQISPVDGSQAPSIGADLEAAGDIWTAWSTQDVIGGMLEGRVYRASNPRDDRVMDWSAPEPVNAGRRGSSPHLVVSSSGDVCIAWEERVGEDIGMPEIFIDCRDHPKTYNLSDTRSVVSNAPSIAYGSQTGAMVAWREGQPTNVIDFRLGPPPSARVEQLASGAVEMPDLVYDGQFGHVVYTVGAGADAEVHYSRLEDVGSVPTATAVPSNTPSKTPSPITPSATPTRTATVAPTTPGPSPTASRTPTREPTPGPGTPSVTPSVTPSTPCDCDIYLPIGQKPRD